jgi:hypothetical protein
VKSALGQSRAQAITTKDTKVHEGNHGVKPKSRVRVQVKI